MARPRSDIGPRIVHAARARFLTEGVDGASLRRIAEEAGTSIGMVYYYFPSKDDLFLAVVEEVYVALLADLERALAPALPVETRLARLVERLGALTPDEILVLRIVVREVLASPSRLRRLIERFQRGHLPLVLRLVHDGFATGTFDRALPPAVVTIALGLLVGPAQVVLQRIARERLLPLALPPGPVGPHLLQLFLRGAAAPARARKKKVSGRRGGGSRPRAA